MHRYVHLDIAAKPEEINLAEFNCANMDNLTLDKDKKDAKMPAHEMMKSSLMPRDEKQAQTGTNEIKQHQKALV